MQNRCYSRSPASRYFTSSYPSLCPQTATTPVSSQEALGSRVLPLQLEAPVPRAQLSCQLPAMFRVVMISSLEIGQEGKQYPYKVTGLWNHQFVNPEASSEHYISFAPVASSRPIPLLEIAMCDCFQI